MILVVEDDADTREALSEILDCAGYSVALAENGLRALESVQRDLPALILLDLSMPVMDGLTLLSNLRKRSELANVPVIVMSANAKGNGRRQLPPNVVEVLSKPIDVRYMMQLVKKHSADHLH
jgi:CheY-like chemotaxis protein